ncbi:dihydrofolate reductase [Blattabacterium cuenoti]|uniref:dihydrofolate reductase n=1 Tax=Blattabacterium cuenoti TaxID=1653831 RepID=UPI00163C4859|nr:dihydrofolate reductase [Blattabacterium cuenoti]
MKIILIASVSKNGFIGKNNELMWHIPNDLIRFKNLTMGETILMGRKTFESIGKILPKRKNIVLTRKNTSSIEKTIKKHNGLVISSVKEIKNLSIDRLFVIGGEQTYISLLDYANVLELTIIHKCFFGDTKFPKIYEKKWSKKYEFFYEKDKKNPYNYSFIRFERK